MVQDNGQETTNEETPKTIDEQVEEVMKGLRPNTADRIVRGVVLAAGIVTGVVFGTASMGWTKWLLRVLSGLLGLGASEAYGWLKTRSDSARFRAIIQSTQNIYAKEGEAKAEAHLRDELHRYEREEKARREEFERRVGDVEAVSAQAQDAKAAAKFAADSVKKTNEHVETLIDRVEVVDKKVNELETSSAKTHKNIMGRLNRLQGKAKEKGVNVESLPTKNKKTATTTAKKTSKKAASN